MLWERDRREEAKDKGVAKAEFIRAIEEVDAFRVSAGRIVDIQLDHDGRNHINNPSIRRQFVTSKAKKWRRA